MPDTYRNPTVEDLLAHSGWIERVARTLVRDVARAEEVAQETWVAALRSPPRDSARIRSWLYSVMTNVVRSQNRRDAARRSREAAVALRDLADDSPDVVARAETQQLVISVVIALDEPYRTTLLLHYINDLTVEAIAARYGVPKETVRTRLRRALERVRERLRERHGDGWIAALAPLVGPSPPAVPGTSRAAPRGADRRAGGRRAARWSIAAGIVVAVGLTAGWFAFRTGVGPGDTFDGARVADPAANPARSTGRAGAATDRAAHPGVGAATPTGNAPAAPADEAPSPAAPPAPAGPGVAFRALASASEPADSLRGVRFRFRPLAKGPVAESEDVLGVADGAGAVEVRLPTSLTDGRPIHSFDVSVEDPTIVPWRTRIDVPKPETPSATFGPLTRAAVFTGRASAADGGPLREAMAVATEAAFPQAAVDSVRVAEDGTFRLRLRPRTPQTVVVASLDHAPHIWFLSPEEPGVRALDPVVLLPGETLSGVVVDASGAPLENVQVHVQSPFLDGKVAAGIHRLTTSSNEVRIYSAERTTGPDGRFAIGGLAVVEHAVTALPRGASATLLGRLSWKATPGGAEQVLRIDAAKLRLQVLREGAPVAKFRVRTAGGPVTARHESDERGEIALLVPPDEDTVFEFGDEPDVRRHTVRSGPAGETVASTVELGPKVEPATWRVRLLGLPEPRGISGVRLHPLDRGEPPLFPPIHDLPVADGEVVAARLAPGRYRAHVRPGTAWHDPANRNAEIVTEIVLSPGQETLSEFRVTPAGRLSIRVLDPEGNRIDARCDLRDVAGNRIRLISRSPGAGGEGEFLDRVEADGPTSVFPTLAPGRYVLHLEETGFHAGRAEFEIRAGEVTEVEATLRR